MTAVLVRNSRTGLAVAAWIFLSVRAHADPGALSLEKPITFVGPEIEAVLDVRKKEVQIRRFSVNKDMPTGRLRHTLPQPYVVRLTSIPKLKRDGITTFRASDWYDGIGVKLKIELLYLDDQGKWRGDINVTTQNEETILYYSAQQLEVRQE